MHENASICFRSNRPSGSSCGEMAACTLTAALHASFLPWLASSMWLEQWSPTVRNPGRWQPSWEKKNVETKKQMQPCNAKKTKQMEIAFVHHQQINPHFEIVWAYLIIFTYSTWLASLEPHASLGWALLTWAIIGSWPMEWLHAHTFVVVQINCTTNLSQVASIKVWMIINPFRTFQNSLDASAWR